jgi:hypothetical protein
MLWGNQETFVQHWQFAQGRNSLDTKALERISKPRDGDSSASPAKPISS